MRKDEVAIIILNWRAYQDTFECIDSLKKLTNCNFSVFLVDNFSNDGSFEKLIDDYKEGLFSVKINFIQTGKNLGFAGGNNIAISEGLNMGYNYFWLLNNDTIVRNNSLSALLNVLKCDKCVGIVGSKIYFYNTRKVWFAGGKINTYTGNTKHEGKGKQDKNKYNQKKEVDYITGCSLLFRRELVESIGYMSEDYFMYYEETEWNLRARKKGWKITYVPESHVFHKVSSSVGGIKKIAPYVAYYDIRNAHLMIKRTQNKLKSFTSYLYKYYKAIKIFLKIFIYNQDNKLIRIKFILKGLLS
ncbi:MAG: glycosyltransferase family 2 protein [Sporolactobacillus sp.]|nr:glycosyltransferase family 2 protein [Sporolactobacillus sp.]